MLDWGLSKRWQMVRRRQTREELKRRSRHVMWIRRRNMVAATWDLMEKETSSVDGTQ